MMDGVLVRSHIGSHLDLTSTWLLLASVSSCVKWEMLLGLNVILSVKGSSAVTSTTMS